tara:strand:+ start:254 stop:733 length:480 start_codon:yes stop_codon:yes gene_type:complete
MWQIPIGVGVGVLYSGQPLKRALIATGLTLAGSALVRAVGWRAAGSTAWFGIQAIGAMTIQSAAAGVIGGAVVGTGVSYALFGKEGAKDAVKLYTGQVPIISLAPESYLGTIAQIPERLAAITTGNRAVEGNAAGLPTGWNITKSEEDLARFRETYPNA